MSAYWRQRNAKRITVEEVREEPSKRTNELLFPLISVCHTGNFNATFVAENVRIPAATLDTAFETGLDKQRLVQEFLRYMNLFSAFVDVGEFDPGVWTLMNEIFDAMFRDDVQFSDFLVDAVLKEKTIFRNCKWNGRKYACKQAPVPLDMASCYYMFVSIQPQG